MDHKFHLKTARYLVDTLENKFQIGKFKFGLDPLLGFFPGGGDILALALSFYLIWIAVMLRLPAEKISLMLGNVMFDFLIGLIPIFGDIADFAYKSNSKNLEIIEDYLENNQIIEGKDYIAYASNIKNKKR